MVAGGDGKSLFLDLTDGCGSSVDFSCLFLVSIMIAD